MARRLFLFFTVMTLTAVAAAWLADRPGRVVIDWQNYRIETSFAAVVLLIVLLFLVVIGLLRFVRWLLHGRARGMEARLRRRQERGEKALARGLTALAAGDAAQAEKYAERAESYMQSSPFVPLLRAQAARLAGDSKKAAEYYKVLARQPETDLLGLRGLLYQALEAGDEDAALKLAARAVSVQPRTGWALNALFDMSLARHDWRVAQKAVDAAVKGDIFSRDEGDRRRAVITLLEAQEKAQAKDWRGAGKLARQAHDKRPDLLPAARLVADSWLRAGKTRRARDFIEKAWAAAPHPDLVRLYRDALKDVSATDQVRRLEYMTSGARDHPESRIALAEAAAEAGMWAMARDTLSPLTEAPTPRVARLMATVAAGEGDEAAERDWLEKAAAPGQPDPRWHCGHCGWEPGDWQAVCERCHSFDTVKWTMPQTALDDGPAAPAWRRLIEPGLIG